MGTFLKSIDLNLKKEVNFPEEKINSSISLNTARLMRAISIRSEELGVNKREVARWFYNKFVLGSEVRGEKILPPENFKKALDDWNKNELSVLKDSVSSLICTEDIANDFENYDGSWLNKDSDVERVTDFDNEVAIHILNFFKNQSKR